MVAASDTSADRLLEVTGLEVSYGAVQVVWGIDLEVGRGQVVSIIGPNGAGKTTTLRALAGLIPARRGRIVFDGRDVTAEPAHSRVGRHLCLVPEGRQLWPRMTVEENLLMGAYPPPLRGRAQRNLGRMYELFPRLRERRHQACGTLSGGERQLGGHAVDRDGDGQRGGEAEERRPVGPDVGEGEQPQQHDDGQRRHERGQQHASTYRGIHLGPGHSALLGGVNFPEG